MARADASTPPRLPRDDSAFFGRDRERQDVLARLDGGARLLTITGLGGVGKSRLALVCAEAAATTRDVVFVSLAEAAGLEATVRAVARACNVRLATESRADAAVRSLATALSARPRRMLLVVDEAEPRTTGAAELASGLLAGAPAVAILATAREPLGVKGEEKLLLGPLSEDEACALLADRARIAAGRESAIDDATARAIVAKTDALPLAVELAAARLDVLSPSELLARLGSMPALRASLEASWQLLAPAEQRTLAQISVLAGAFDVDTAERIVDLGAAHGEDDVVDVLSALVQRCFLARADAGSTRARLRVLETVRSWAATKLEELGLLEATSRRHLEQCLDDAERWAKRTYGEGGGAALDALDALLPDAQLALSRWKEREPALAARLVAALSDALLFRGLLDLRARLTEEGALAAERAGDEKLLARVLATQARVLGEVGDTRRAEAELRRAIELAGRAGDVATRLDAERTLGWLQIAKGAAGDAEASLRGVRDQHRARGEARGDADACAALGVLFALTGRRAAALASFQEALGIHVETGDTLRQEKVLGFGALVGFDTKQLARGLPRDVLSRAPERSMAVLPASVAEVVAGEAEAGRRWREALDDYLAGAAAEGRGETADALAAFERALAGFRSASMKRGVAAVQAHAAVAFELSGDSAEADARLEAAQKAAGDDLALARVVSAFAAATQLARARAAEPAALDAATKAAATALAQAELVEGAPPELVAARAVLARLLGEETTATTVAADLPPPSLAGRRELVVGPEARWFSLGGGPRADLVRYGPVRRLLDTLVATRLERPGAALSAEDLIAAGWPGERMRHTAGLLRVYSGIRRLRRMGLEEVLVTRDDGYLVDAATPVRRAAS